jgi:hypothetical protein
MDKSTATKLVEAWIVEKQIEAASRRRRAAIETRLVESGHIQTVDNGSKTSRIGNHRITVKTGYNYSIDAEKWEEVKDLIPEASRPVKTKLVVNESEVKKLMQWDKENWERASHAITMKPAKSYVKIEEVD